jgi:hypothetical protein
MNTATKVAGFAAVLLAAFAGAAAIGALVGPTGPGSAAGETDSHSGGHSSPASPDQPALPGGLMVSQDGYRLELTDRVLPADRSHTLRFRILGPDGAPVTSYTREHGKDLHLIAVRRDLTGFQHVHPELATDGTWSVPLDLTAAGVHRVFADFTPAGHSQSLTLGADLSVTGTYQPEPLPVATRTVTVDGYAVTLDGELAAGRESELTLTVSKHGQPVTDLQPYLEAYGHLVALRDRDLAYLHVHPAGHPGDGTTPAGPGITFYATAPSDGAYRLFLDFKHNDQVRTAAFTVQAGSVGDQPAEPLPATTSPTSAPEETSAGHGHEHGG